MQTALGAAKSGRHLLAEILPVLSTGSYLPLGQQKYFALSTSIILLLSITPFSRTNGLMEVPTLGSFAVRVNSLLHTRSVLSLALLRIIVLGRKLRL